jgi:predicted dinucleotide-binding enzyme
MASKKVAVLGSGAVGEVLANGFLGHGFEVMRGTREPQKLRSWAERAGQRASTGTLAATAAWGELLVLAVKGSAAAAVLDACGNAALAGKTIIDVTNPIADVPPTNGVLHFFTSLDDSLLERLQKQVPKAHFVKAFSCVGNANMVNPNFGGVKPTMFICGNDVSAKAEVTHILERFGWESADMGEVEAARAIEPLCMLWCIPGFRSNQWTHAFKLLRR